MKIEDLMRRERTAVVYGAKRSGADHRRRVAICDKAEVAVVGHLLGEMDRMERPRLIAEMQRRRAQGL